MDCICEAGTDWPITKYINNDTNQSSGLQAKDEFSTRHVTTYLNHTAHVVNTCWTRLPLCHDSVIFWRCSIRFENGRHVFILYFFRFFSESMSIFSRCRPPHHPPELAPVKKCISTYIDKRVISCMMVLTFGQLLENVS